ncbi:MAG: hypothetical protein ABIH67_01155 [Candidatus Uhrbacteria bacterium]
MVIKKQDRPYPRDDPVVDLVGGAVVEGSGLLDDDQSDVILIGHFLNITTRVSTVTSGLEMHEFQELELRYIAVFDVLGVYKYSLFVQGPDTNGFHGFPSG